MKRSYRINILFVCALIILAVSYLFPFIIHESSVGLLSPIWLWGAPSNISTLKFALMLPFMILSIGIIVEAMVLFCKLIAMRNYKEKLKIKSQELIKRGKHVVYIEMMWILCFYLVFSVWPFGFYYIQTPIFFPLIGGTILIVVGNLSKPVDLEGEIGSFRKYNLKLMNRIYDLIFILYSFIFLIFFMVSLYPNIFFEILFEDYRFKAVFFNIIVYGSYNLNPLLLTIIIIKIEKILNEKISISPQEFKNLNVLYIQPPPPTH